MCAQRRAAPTAEELLATILRLSREFCLRFHGVAPTEVCWRLPDGSRHCVPVSAYSQPPAVTGAVLLPSAPHVEADGSRAEWPGLGAFAFGGERQRRAVVALHEAWEDGRPDVPEQELMDAAGSDGRARDLFRGHPAWRTLVVPGERAGTYRLAEPG